MATEELFSRYKLGDDINLVDFWNRIIVEAEKETGTPIPSDAKRDENLYAQAMQDGNFDEKIGVLDGWSVSLREGVFGEPRELTANWLYNQIAILESNLAVDVQDHGTGNGYRADKPKKNEDKKKKADISFLPEIPKSVAVAGGIGLIVGFMYLVYRSTE